jgi:REP element-mobilizing transposase RayT
MPSRRKYTRLRGYNYAACGAYFLTINTHDRSHLFGIVVGDTRGARVDLSAQGWIVQECWDAIPDHFPNVHLDTFQIMPDHVHAIVVILGDDDPQDATMDGRLSYMAPRSVADNGAGRGGASTLRGARRPNGVETRSIGAIVGSFKSAVTKRINMLRGTPGAPVWQRNYHDRIIRNAAEHVRIANYIRDNPMNWLNGRGVVVST